jgi:hypothetical protein
MWLHRCNAFDGQDGSEWNDDKENVLLEWNLKWANDAQHMRAIKEPVATSYRIGIPDKKEKADGQNAQRCAFKSAENSSF